MHFIYEVVEFVGRWSMIDVFVIAVPLRWCVWEVNEYYPSDGCAR